VGLACAGLAFLFAMGHSWADPAPPSCVAPRLGDAYEPDDTCEQARPISTTGVAQSHTFHRYGDTDWISFTAQASQTYWIQVTDHASPTAVSVELYNACPPSTCVSPLRPVTAPIRWTAQSSGPHYIKAIAQSPDVYGPHVGYDLSVAAERHIYLPLVAHHFSASEYTLPPNLPSVETFYPLTDTARAPAATGLCDPECGRRGEPHARL
jgi:hypothetical protein